MGGGGGVELISKSEKKLGLLYLFYFHPFTILIQSHDQLELKGIGGGGGGGVANSVASRDGIHKSQLMKSKSFSLLLAGYSQSLVVF